MKTISPFIKLNHLAGLALAIIAALTISMAAQAAIGNSDPTFGAGGKVTTFIGSSNSFANAVTVQPDGKIVVTGIPLLVRYNSDGTLDTTFGINGIVANSGLDRGMDLVIQPDGKILVVGYRIGGQYPGLYVARFNTNGSPDSTFGTNEIALATNFHGCCGNNVSGGHSITLRPNGKIFAAGSFSYGPNASYMLASLNNDGSQDTFNIIALSTQDYLTAIAVQPDGKIILAGTTYPGTFIDYSGPSLGFARFYYTTYSDGSNHFLPDPSFGTNGSVIPYFGSLGFVDYSAALQSDGKIVAIGEYGSKPNGYKYTLARFNNDGSPDTSFGANGLNITDFSDISDVNYNFLGNQSHFLAIQSDGKLVVTGDNSNGHFFVARFNSNGSLDTSFGTNGKITTSFGTSNDVRAIVLQPDGKIIAAGSTSNGTNTGIVLARYVVANVTSVTATFISEAANDGTILESYQNSGVGGTQNGFATTISVGDDPGNRQYRSILSFHTQAIPDNAVITAAQLMIRYQGTVGTDPFLTFGNLLVDIHSGYFGNSIGLELADFSAPASPSTYQEHLSPMPYNWYGTNLSTASNLELVNKFGWTQFRLRFALPSNKDNVSDYYKFYSGGGPVGSQPELIVTYYVP